MFIFKELEVKNVLLYKNASIDLNHKGVSVIYGENRDAGRNSTNAAGKSLLFSQIPELLGISPPLTNKADKRKNGVASLKFASAKQQYQVIRKAKKRGEKLILIEEGQDKHIHKKTYALKKLQHLHGWTEDEFYSIVYIDSRRPNLLHMGTTKQRRDFIISMFRLSNVDNLRKYFNAELRRIAEDRSAYEEVKRQYNSLSEQLVDESELEIQEQIERLEKVYKKLSERVTKASALEELLQFRRDNKKSIRRLLKITDRNLDSVDKSIDSCKKRIEKLEDALEHAISWTKHKDRIEEYKKKAKHLLIELAKYTDITPLGALQGAKEYQRLSQKIDHVRSTIRDNKKRLPKKVDINQEALEIPIDEYSTRLSNYTQLLEQAKKFRGGSCPVCNQPVKIHNTDTLRKKIANLSAKLDVANSAREAVEIRTRRREIIKLNKELKSRLVKLKKERRVFKRHEEANKIYENLPEKPKEYEGKKYDEEKVREALSKNKIRLGFLTSVEPLVDKIKKALALSEEDKQETYHLPDLRKRLDAVVERLPSLKSSFDKMKTVKKSMAELKVRAKELVQSVKDEQAFELLVEAYGNSGIKKLMLQRIGSHLEQCLNRYSRFVFSERYEFKVNIDTQFDIVVRRRLADRVVVSDVRRLSGAESKAFILLLYLSLLSLIPSNRRSNLLILDEPDANLGPEMRENLKRFIPILNKIVPHIVIITPHTDMRYEGARVFTVVKERGYSRIVESK